MIREFSFIVGPTKTPCTPLGFTECTYQDELNDTDGKYFWRRTLKGKLTFIKEDFNFLMGYENANMRCTPIYLLIKKRCHASDEGIVEYLGVLKLVDMDFDLSRCTIVGEVPPQDDYTCIVNMGDKDINILTGTTKTPVYYIIG